MIENSRPITPETLNDIEIVHSEPVEIMSDDIPMRGKLFIDSDALNDGKKDRPACMFIPGFKRKWQKDFDEDHLAEFTKAFKGIVLVVDLAGQGESGGDLSELSLKNHQENMLAAYNYLTQRPEVDPKKMGVVGHSLGASISVLLRGVAEPKPKELLQGLSEFYPDYYLKKRKDYKREEISASRSTFDLVDHPGLIFKALDEQGLEGVTIVEGGEDTWIDRAMGRAAMYQIANKQQGRFLHMGNMAHILDGNEDAKNRYWKYLVNVFAHSIACN